MLSRNFLHACPHLHLCGINRVISRPREHARVHHIRSDQTAGIFVVCPDPPPLTKSRYGEVRLRIGTTCLSAALFAPAWLWSRDWQKCCNESSSSGTSSHRQWALWTWWWSRRVFPKPGCRGLWKAGREGFHNIQMMKFQHVNHFSFSEWNEPLCSTVLSKARAFRLYLKDSCST